MAPVQADENISSTNSFALGLWFEESDRRNWRTQLHESVARAGQQADIALDIVDDKDNDEDALLNEQQFDLFQFDLFSEECNCRKYASSNAKFSPQMSISFREWKSKKNLWKEIMKMKTFSQETAMAEVKEVSEAASSVGCEVLSVEDSPKATTETPCSACLRGKLLVKQKSGAENALHWLRFISKTTGEANAGNADSRVFWKAVEARFQNLANSDGMVSRADFGLCIGMKDSDEFALELFDALARRKGLYVQSINKEELHGFCLEISDPSFDSRLQIFFDMCDKNVDGRISEGDVTEIIRLSAFANQLSRIKDRAEEYAASIMEELDPDDNGYIEIRQLQTLLLQGSAYGRENHINYDRSLSEELTVAKKNPLQTLMDRNWQRVWGITLWLAVMAGLFLWKFIQYRNRAAFKVIGYCLCTAKASAETLKFNMALILLPVCRNTITWLRRSPFLGSIVPFDDNINFHKTIAGAIIVGVILHAGNHLACDFPRIVYSNDEDYNLYLQDFFGTKKPSYRDLVRSVTGISGIVMIILMTTAFVLATTRFRRNLVKIPWQLNRLTGFNAFWYSHHSFVIVYVLLILHSFFLYLVKGWAHKTTWMYIVVPLLLYCGERTLRAFRACKYTVNIVKAAIYPGNVLALHMSKPAGFNYSSGMYLFLQCPEISPFEWHPFSITSAPDDNFISVHIRTAGDWTMEMKRVFSKTMKPHLAEKSGHLRAETVPPDETPFRFPRLKIDGPYGAPAQNYKKYEVVLLIGLGIGATPFISVLKDILNNTKVAEQKSNEFSESKGKKVPIAAHFYWVTREQGSFDWFNGVLNEVTLIDHMAGIEIHNYLTSVYEEGDARSAPITMLQALHHAKNGVDILSGTRVKTHFARPKWKKVFSNVASAHKGTTIGVFYCGPLILAKELKNITKDFNYKSNTTKFKFQKENF